jgi:hypothetical protein
MKKNAAFALLLVALTFAAGRAGATPTAFDYSFSASPGMVSSGTGSVTFAILPSSGPVSINLGQELPLQAAQVFPSSTANSPGDSYNAPFTLNLHIKDNDTVSHEGDLSFSGRVVGALTSSGSDLHVVFDSPGTQTKPIGSLQYMGTVDPKDGPVPGPIGGAFLLLNVNLTVTVPFDNGGQTPGTPGGPDNGGPGPGPGHSHTPEPSALLLGLSAAALVYWRRRRAA